MSISDRQKALLLDLYALQQEGLIDQGGNYYCDSDYYGNMQTDRISGALTKSGIEMAKKLIAESRTMVL